MKRHKFSTPSAKVAGIDVSKRWLDVWALSSETHVRFERTPDGLSSMVVWFQGQGIVRVGLEASGGYEQIVCEALHEGGLEVVLHQPAEVRHFARYRRIRAKSDKIDACMIALATADSEDDRLLKRHPASRPLAGLMTLYQHLGDLLSQARAFAEHVELEAAKGLHQNLVAELKRRKEETLRLVLAHIRQAPAQQADFDLLTSLPGVGPVVAAGLLAYMPELGQLQHGQPAALLGVAPFDSDSGDCRGKRIIAGGRRRPRELLYLAALAAKRMDTPFKLFYDRLINAGKPVKLAIVAVMRKLIEAANIVVKRKTPWTNVCA